MTAIASQRHLGGTASRIGRRFAAMRRSGSARRFDDCLVVEAKAVEKTDPMRFKMQALTYMKLLNLPLGLVINFGGTTLKGHNVWRVILKDAGRMEEPCPF